MNSVPSGAFDISECEILRESQSGKAVYITAPLFNDEEQCIPRNCIHELSNVKDVGDYGTLLVYANFAESRKWL